MTKLFQYTGINPKNEEELKYIKENGVRIDKEDFLQDINKDDYNFLMLDIEDENDGEQEYYKSVNLDGRDVYYIEKLERQYIFY